MKLIFDERIRGRRVALVLVVGRDRRRVGALAGATAAGAGAAYLAHRVDRRKVLDAALAEAHSADPGVEVQVQLAEGRAATALMAAGRNADLLVVGSRGRGGFAGLLLGSVSAQCVHHAPCPVVVVPAPRAEGK